MEVASNKKIYFLSDFHLGAPNGVDSLVRETMEDVAEVFRTPAEPGLHPDRAARGHRHHR